MPRLEVKVCGEVLILLLLPHGITYLGEVWSFKWEEPVEQHQVWVVSSGQPCPLLLA